MTSRIIDDDDFDLWMKENGLHHAIHTFDASTATVSGNGVVLHAKVKALFFNEKRVFAARTVAWTTDQKGKEVPVRNLTAILRLNGEEISKKTSPHGAMISTGIVVKQLKDDNAPSASGRGSSQTPPLYVETEEIFSVVVH